MLDWRLGEKHFMQSLIDGDLASNNLGWQWCASTGPDASPYFRIFAPLSQSLKSDESGDYIRRWVPELAHLKGKALHDPSTTLGKAGLAKIGYPAPIVDHAKARLRAIARYKTPGCSDNE
jgi:deoxyribodipyrimidine photo-lyase